MLSILTRYSLIAKWKDLVDDMLLELGVSFVEFLNGFRDGHLCPPGFNIGQELFVHDSLHRRFELVEAPSQTGGLH